MTDLTKEEFECGKTMLRSKFIIILVLIIQAISRTDQAQEDCATPNGCFTPEGYNKHDRPNSTGGATLVNMSIWIESFGKIDITKMEYETFGYLTQEWHDERFAKITRNKTLSLHGQEIHLIWTPDIYCLNCRKTSLDRGRNDKQSMVILQKNGDIYYSVGIKLTASCQMNLKMFPFDAQTCELQFSSYGYNMSYLKFYWKEVPTILSRSLDQFEVTSESTRTEVKQYLSGEYDVMHSSFIFNRRIGFYVLQLYVPTIMLVCLSWSMFFLTQEHSGDRLTIGVTLFLTMILLHGYVNSSLPKVSYIKAVDWFMLVSLSSIILIIFESLITTRLFMIEKDKKRYMASLRKYNQLKQQMDMDSFNDVNDATNTPMQKEEPSQQTQTLTNSSFTRPIIYTVDTTDGEQHLSEREEEHKLGDNGGHLLERYTPGRYAPPLNNAPPLNKKYQMESLLSFSGSGEEYVKNVCQTMGDNGNNGLERNECSMTLHPPRRERCLSWRERKLYQKIEYLSTVLFPLVFTCYLCWYCFSNFSKK